MRTAVTSIRRTPEDGTFKVSSGLSVETLARNIIRVVESATAEQLSAGLRWYPDAQAIAKDLQVHSGETITIEQAAGIIAALSPRCQWVRNVQLAFEAVDDGPCRTLGRSRDAAFAIVHGAQPQDVLKGPKVRAFVEAIASGGQSGIAVVDVWAVRAATSGE
jgi:hypothetical protein